MELVVLFVALLCATHAKIYFEESFDDDSWSERWVTPKPNKPVYCDVGEFKRSAGMYYGLGSLNNTGLKVGGPGKFCHIATRFSEFDINNNTMVLQFSLNFDYQPYSCHAFYIYLYKCDFDLAHITDRNVNHTILVFGPNFCKKPSRLDVLFRHQGNYYNINKTIYWQTDRFTHVYTLIIRPNQTYQVLIDHKSKKNGYLKDDWNFPSPARMSDGPDDPYYSYEPQTTSQTFPPVCEIGIRFLQEDTGAIFDNILVTDDADVAERRNLKIQEMGVNWGRLPSIAVIESEDLKDILMSRRSIEFKSESDNSTELFLTEFRRFLVSFDWNDSSVIKATAEYNKNHFETSERDKHEKNWIQLWISFQPRNNISEDIEAVARAVKEADSIYPGTVNYVVINYGFLIIDHHSQQFVNHEIRKVSKTLKSLFISQYPYFLGYEYFVRTPNVGIQLDILNCRNKVEYLAGLELGLAGMVLFTQPEGHIFARNEIDGATAWTLCRPWIDTLLSKAITDDIWTGFAVNKQYSVEVNIKEGVYKHDRNQPINSLKEYSLIHVHVYNGTVGKSFIDYDNKISENVIKWLHQPTKFSASHFGAVISSEENSLGPEMLASKLFSVFRKFLVQPSPLNYSSNNSNLKEVVVKMIEYSNSVLDGQGHQFTQDIPLQMSIYEAMETMDFHLWKVQLDKAVSAVVAGNQLLPGSVNAVIVDWLACWASEDCSGYVRANKTNDCTFVEMYQNIFNIHIYANTALRKAGNDNTVKIGVTMDKHFIRTVLDMVGNHKCTKNDLHPFRNISVIVCKATVKQSEIAQQGGLKMFHLVKVDLALCESTSQTLELTTNIFVNVIGCVADYSNFTQLVEYALLLDKLSSWAAAGNKTLFTDAGTERQSKCDYKNVCTCGWWVNAGTPDKAFGSAFNDKKSVALHLYRMGRNTSNSNKKDSPSTDSTEMLSWILPPMLLFVVVITTMTTIIVLRYRSKYILTKQEITEFVKGRKSSRTPHVQGFTEGDNAAEIQSYNSDKYELKLSVFTIDITSRCLGSGEFGKVYRGSIRRDGNVIEAAVKVTNTRVVGKGHGYYLALKGLLSEIKVLAYLGDHNHVVTLLGAYTKNVRKGEIAVFLELCQLGSLDKYLRSMKPQIRIEDGLTEHNEYQDTSSGDQFSLAVQVQFLDEESLENLIRWAEQIAIGMEFLASKKLIHGDLATRNVLLTSEKVAKICDFGLSRRLYEYTEYVKQSQAPLPWRWMAPESLCRMFFNEKTDIWSFGITLWEMFTLGDEPYPGLSWTPNFSTLLDRGMRLPEPRFNAYQIYSIMQRCWDISPAFRPTFADLKSELKSLGQASG